MAVVHVIPVPCIFESTIQQRADALGHECFRYNIHRSPRANVVDFWRLYIHCKRNPDHLFVFHKVPHFRLFILSLLLRQFNYCLLYWGEDYYSTFVDENAFEQHCIKKSKLLRSEHYGQKKRWIHRRWLESLRQQIGFHVLGRATAWLSGYGSKQIRIARFFYFRRIGAPLRTPVFSVCGYAPEIDATSQHAVAVQPGALRVLICHSATPTAAPHQSLQIIKDYKRRWGCKVHIDGFLSYSGGDEAYRDALERDLVRAAEFADSVVFERKFLSPESLKEKLGQIDLAVFSCLRDEGVGILTQLVNAGGLVSFNRFSIDYDYFKSFCPEKLLTHEQFLASSPEELWHRRMLPSEAPPRVMKWSQFEELHNVAGRSLPVL